MRSRNIKPGFYKNESLAECSLWARYICPGLWMMADRLGRMEDRPKRIKAELLAYDNVDVEPLLQELAQYGHILRYETDGNRYIQILSFTKHQSPHHTENSSVIPGPSADAKRNIPKTLPEKSSMQTPCHGVVPGTLPEHSGSDAALKTPPLPPDSLIPDSLIPESPGGDARARVREGEKSKDNSKLPNLSRLPFDSLPPEWAQWVQADMGWNAETTADVWACFRDYWQGKTGKSARKSDWGATWRVWCRKENIRNSGGHHATTIHHSAQGARPSRSERFKQALVDSTIEELDAARGSGGNQDPV